MKPSGERSATKIIRLATSTKIVAISWRSESVAASLLCLLKTLAATNCDRRPLGDLVATIIKLHRDFCKLFAIAFLVADRARRGRKLCATGALRICKEQREVSTLRLRICYESNIIITFWLSICRSSDFKFPIGDGIVLY